MKEIVIYECSDGKRFDKKLDAEMYECILGVVENIMAPLGTKPNSFNAFKHEKEIVETSLAKLMELCGDTIITFKESFKKTTINCIRNISARVLSDYSDSFPCLWMAYERFMCISPTSFIEYDQPYWAYHEEEFIQTMSRYKKEGVL